MLDFKFPDVGEGIHEGVIVKWRVKEGDEVKSDQVLVEIETDKAIVEIPSPRTGIIAKTFHKENEVIKVGESLVMIADKGEVYNAAMAPVVTPPTSAPATTSVPTQTPAPDSKGPGVVGSIDASGTEIPSPLTPKISAKAEVPAQKSIPAIKILPATRVLATKLGVDLTKITSTGANGMITDSDVMAAASISTSATSTSESASHTITTAPILSKTFPGPTTRTPYRGVRKAIGDNMTKSHTSTVPVTHFDTVDVTKLIEKRNQEKPQAEAKNIKLTFLAYIVKAVTETLKEFPTLNSELDEASQEIVNKNFYNIGIAVDTEDGLYVPTIKDADKKDIFTIAQEIAELAEKARTKKLTPQEMQNGTFTITNYGSIGGDFATPVINYPEAAILGIGKMKDAFIIDSTTKQPVATKTMGLALTFDHRLLDGATAARFVNMVAQKLQS
jgi:pyruvate dehydrogenase E2 component (dihydrolipoamide acetyltransferase)